MSDSIFSPSWYRVAELRPRLRAHANIHRHDYRGEIWYVLQDPLSGRFYRFTPAAYQVIGLLDGKRTVNEVWEMAASRLEDDAPTQEEVIRLLAQLHAADVLQSEISPDILELFNRFQRQEKLRWKQRFWSPLAIRFPLIDPERFLALFLPIVRPFFSLAGFLAWVLIVCCGAIVTFMHWPELTENFTDRVLAPQNLLLLWITYPVIKTLHELGHAFATKVWGGEVHEIGIMLLVFMPVPYVDASAAYAFKERYKRMIVGAMGIMVELLLAVLALFVWLAAEQSFVRALSYNAMLIGGISTLFFNGNPLLRFDGYYVLADALEIPNLGKRSNQYLGYLVQRYLFSEKSAVSPANSESERKWLVIYSIASFCYRLVVMFSITLFVAGKFFFIGVLIAIWAVVMLLVVPIFRMMKYVFSNPRLERCRGRAVTVTSAGLGTVLCLLTMLPVPLWTRAEGVVWLPEQAIIRAGTDCFITAFLTPPDRNVSSGHPLIGCEEPTLQAKERMLLARLEELEALHTAQWREDRVAASITQEEIKAVKSDLLIVREQLSELLIRSPLHGQFVVPRSRDIIGRYVRKGEILGYVITGQVKSVHVVVPQSDVGLVRERTESVTVRIASRLQESYSASMVRQIPGGSKRLPSAALGKNGGGQLDIDPRDDSGTMTLNTVFEYELVLPEGAANAPVGTRVYVRFDHGSQALAVQWYLRLRQIFLRTFNV